MGGAGNSRLGHQQGFGGAGPVSGALSRPSPLQIRRHWSGKEPGLTKLPRPTRLRQSKVSGGRVPDEGLFGDHRSEFRVRFSGSGVLGLGSRV